MPIPFVLTGAAAAAKSAVVGRAVQGIQGLFGDTPDDRARAARVDTLLNAALNGDTSAVRQLTFDAFEPRRGLTGDARTPRDGKKSPGVVQSMARRALQRYLAAGGKLPTSLLGYAVRIGVPVAAEELSVAEELAGAVADAAGARAATAATATVRAEARSYLPVVFVLALLAVVMYAATRNKAA